MLKITNSTKNNSVFKNTFERSIHVQVLDRAVDLRAVQLPCQQGRQSRGLTVVPALYRPDHLCEVEASPLAGGCARCYSTAL